MDRLIREANPPVDQLASPIPQYKKPGSTDYEAVEGQHGAPFATLKDASGNVVSPATEATLEQVRALLSGVATENKLEQARALLEAISTKDFATSSKQDALNIAVEDLKDAISGKDFATQTTLAAVLAKLADLESELATIKANQLSGDQKVTLSGTIVEHKNNSSNPFRVVHGVNKQRHDREFYPFPVDNLKKVVVYIDNRRGLRQISDVAIALYPTKNATMGDDYYERTGYSVIPAGGELVIPSTAEIFQSACVGIGVSAYCYSSTDPSEVDYDIFIMGAV